MTNEELTNKYYELASQVTALAMAANELKEASHKGEAPKRIESGTIDADKISYINVSK